MSGFSDVQAELAKLLRRRRSISADGSLADASAQIATGNDRLSPAEQIEIYREQFWLRHTSCLVEDFVGLGGIMGQTDWERLVEEYLEKYPPLSFNLRDLGQLLPRFVEESTWLPHHELCVDMARVEWAYIEVFDAADSAALDPARLASIPESAWETARLTLNPALRMLRVRYPVAALRRDLRLGKSDVAIPEPEAQNLVVYRAQDRNLHHEALDDGAFAILEALGQGTALVPACQAAIERLPAQASGIEAELAGWFQRWATLSFIVGVDA
ncbi:MAG: putative DNA-binding domain-containing protein [Myxococcales bacterium]|nr:putative DNA-binding domain-containing protein [Myxococcales bacterium]